MTKKQIQNFLDLEIAKERVELNKLYSDLDKIDPKTPDSIKIVDSYQKSYNKIEKLKFSLKILDLLD